MSTTHLSVADLARVLDGDVDDATRAHLRSCAQCSAALESEAKLDEDVSALSAHVAFCPSCDRAREHADTLRCDWCGVAFAPGGFVVEKVLAESDHGRLYLAKSSDGDLVALKEIVFARVPDVEALERFEREARLLKQLQHPRIPRYLASFSEGEGVHLRLYLAQRYVDGPALDDEMETRRFTEADARSIAKEVLAILVDLQALSPPVLHRDVKPANLVRDKGGKLSLVDFGSARDVQKTTGGTLVGTFGYMPVEQLSGIVDESTDVYALAATLVHLLTRRPPWESRSTSSGGSIAMPSFKVTPPFRKFLSKCLAARDKRFDNAKQALDAVIALDTIAVPRVAAVLGALAVSTCVAATAAVAVHFAHAEPTGKAHGDLAVKLGPPTPPTPPTPPLLPNPLSSNDARNALLLKHMFTPVPCWGLRAELDIDLGLTIKPDGTLSSTRLPAADATATACVEKEVAKWTFPAVAGLVDDATIKIHVVPPTQAPPTAKTIDSDLAQRTRTPIPCVGLKKATEIELSFDVLPTGTVQHISTSEQDVPESDDDTTAHQCVIKDAMSWTFPPFDGAPVPAVIIVHAIPWSDDDGAESELTAAKQAAKDAAIEAAKNAAMAKAREMADKDAPVVDDEKAAAVGVLAVRCDIDCTVSVDGKIPRAAPAKISVAAGTHSLDAYGVGNDTHVTQSFEMRAGGETRIDLSLQKHHFSGKKITVDLQDAELTNFLRLVAQVAGKNIAINDNDFRGTKITMNFKNTPWDEALDAIARTHNLEIDVSPTMITVKPKPAPTLP